MSVKPSIQKDYCLQWTRVISAQRVGLVFANAEEARRTEGRIPPIHVACSPRQKFIPVRAQSILALPKVPFRMLSVKGVLRRFQVSPTFGLC